MPRFEIFLDAAGQYRFRLIAPNGEIIAVGEGYPVKASALAGVEEVKRHANSAGTIDLT